MAFSSKCFGGHQESFDKRVDDELKNVEGGTAVPEKVKGRQSAFQLELRLFDNLILASE